jgi:hypothetical protein
MNGNESTTAPRVGDADPTPELDDVTDYCWAPLWSPERARSMYCSWPLDHDGAHVSADVGVGVVAVWSGDEPPEGRIWAPRDQRPWVFGPRGGRTEAQWTDAMVEEGRRIGVNRQCSIGWHDECSDPDGDTCRCACHTDGSR